MWPLVEWGVYTSVAYIFVLSQFGACGNLSSCGRGSEMILSGLQPACPLEQRTIAAVYPDQPREIAATVWYNNQVRNFLILEFSFD